MTEPNDTLEAVARAIAEVYHGRPVSDEYLLGAATGGRAFLELARAAIKALAEREPSEEQLEAGTLEHFGTKRGEYHYKGGDARSVESIYRAMLGALVKEIGE